MAGSTSEPGGKFALVCGSEAGGWSPPPGSLTGVWPTGGELLTATLVGGVQVRICTQHASAACGPAMHDGRSVVCRYGVPTASRKFTVSERGSGGARCGRKPGGQEEASQVLC